MLQQHDVKYFDVIQNCNETLFVPSRWYHQVHNIDDSVSVNHNWFNGCNIKLISETLVGHFDDVEREIFDCRDMENFYDHCQLMLKTSFGMNFQDFFDIISHIACKRIDSVANGIESKSFEVFKLGISHILYDLKSIYNVCCFLKENVAIKKYSCLINQLIELGQKINEHL